MTPMERNMRATACASDKRSGSTTYAIAHGRGRCSSCELTLRTPLLVMPRALNTSPGAATWEQLPQRQFRDWVAHRMSLLALSAVLSPGVADAVGNRGTTIRCEFYNDNVSGHGFGGCLTSTGAAYRLQY